MHWLQAIFLLGKAAVARRAEARSATAANAAQLKKAATPWAIVFCRSAALRQNDDASIDLFARGHNRVFKILIVNAILFAAASVDTIFEGQRSYMWITIFIFIIQDHDITFGKNLELKLLNLFLTLITITPRYTRNFIFMYFHGHSKIVHFWTI